MSNRQPTTTAMSPSTTSTSYNSTNGGYSIVDESSTTSIINNNKNTALAHNNNNNNSAGVMVTASQVLTAANNNRGCYACCPETETTTTDDTEEQLLLRGLTWTDDYFANHHQEQDDIVAVFDYDHAALDEMKVGTWFVLIYAPLLVITVLASIIATIRVLADDLGPSYDHQPPSVIIPLTLFGICLALCGFHRPAKSLLRRYMVSSSPDNDHHTAHTAMTRTGVRHVVLATEERPGYVLDIPYCDILSVKITPVYNNGNGTCHVTLTLASTDDGIEYVTNGYCQFAKNLMTMETSLTLTALEEPVLFKKLIVGRLDDPTSAVSLSNKGARLLARVEACLARLPSLYTSTDNPHIAAHAAHAAALVGQLVTELREFNLLQQTAAAAATTTAAQNNNNNGHVVVRCSGGGGGQDTTMMTTLCPAATATIV